jgi:DNA integrity scanning protein DisA with diadenylate cyclase activity
MTPTADIGQPLKDLRLTSHLAPRDQAGTKLHHRRHETAEGVGGLMVAVMIAVSHRRQAVAVCVLAPIMREMRRGTIRSLF